MRVPDFTIVAMPRCGTAWLSNLLSLGRETICFTDMLSRAAMGKPIDPPAPIYKRFGNADSLYCLRREVHPDVPTVLIRRGERPLQASLARAGFSPGQITRFHEGMEELKAKSCVVGSIDYARIFQRGEESKLDACREIWQLLIPGVEWDMSHFTRVSMLHINTHISPDE